jgi:aspartate ammonia-lyase
MATRIESDFLGPKELPDDAYYGVQTLRGKENFHITGISMSTEPYFVKAFGYVKKAAAMANRDLGVLDAQIADAIVGACDRLIAGELREQFVTDFIQGGAGTSSHMNANEVIANLALEHLGHKKGEYQYVNPNDHVNFGQSTNDVYPTAFRLALILRLGNYVEALRRLQDAFFAKGKEFEKVLKMGRTHLQDAVPMSLGQEFHGWGTTLGEEVQRIAEVRQFLHEINLGATAIGTSVTAAPGYPELTTRYLSELTDVHPRWRPDRGNLGHRRLCAALRRAQANFFQAYQDLQRHPLAGIGATLRLERDQSAADAAGLVDHARQGESGDSGGRQPGGLPRHRA